jgi:8-oxo-dGTP pyrophosphatase MutT (NUDIX family)
MGLQVGLHADAVAVLTAWVAPDDVQDRLRADYLAHLRRQPDGMWRECRPDHLTASALVIDPSRRQVLLALHRKARLWLQMGGHCEAGDETLAATALREAREESGIEDLALLPEPVRLDRHGAPCDPAARHHLDVQYVALAPPGARERCSDESDELRWTAYDRLPEPTDDAVRRLVSAAAAATGTRPRRGSW